jgi:hypothetical protein
MRRALVAVALLALAALTLWRAHRRPPPSTPPKNEPSALATPTPPGERGGAPPASPPLVRDAGAVRVVLRASWGNGPGQLGRRADPESVAEGPMSFIADARGVTVLDNVNARVARFDAGGRALPPIALDSEAAQDLARAGDRVAVLDRLRARRVTLYDDGGGALGAALLVGPGIDEAGGVTGVFADRSGNIFVEREHRAWIERLGADGRAPTTPPTAPGRPTRDGGFVAAAIVDRNAGTVVVHRFAADGSPRWDALVRLGAPILFLALVDADAAGEVYVAAHTGQPSATPPYAIVDERLRVAAVANDGSVVPSQLSVPAPPPREETFRDLSVGDDGTIYWMRRTPDGVVIEAYRL